MFVRDIMTKDVECIHPDTAIHQAAKKMREMNVGAMPICGDDDRLVGIVTDRDIAIRAVAEDKNPRSTPVRDIMTSGIVYCYDDQDLIEAAQLMEEKQLRRLAVLNRNKRLVGIVSLGDLAVKTQDLSLAGEAIEAISEPVHV